MIGLRRKSRRKGTNHGKSECCFNGGHAGSTTGHSNEPTIRTSSRRYWRSGASPQRCAGQESRVLAKAIRLRWNKARESILEVGRLIVEARKTLSPEEYAKLRKYDLPFDYSVLQKLKALAASKRINDPSYKDLLTHSWNTLVEIMNLPDDAFEFGIKEGIINEKTPWKKIKDLRQLFDKPLPKSLSNPPNHAVSAPTQIKRATTVKLTPADPSKTTITVKRSDFAKGTILVVVSKEVADAHTKELADLNDELLRLVARYPFIGEVKVESKA